MLEEFLRDPWFVRPGGVGDSAAAVATVQVLVPKVEPAPVAYGGGDGEDAYSASAHVKRMALQRQAVAASLAAESYARKMEVIGAADSPGEPVLGEQVIDLTRDDQGSTIKVMCRLCFSGENEGSDRALKMLSCPSCNKKYHRRCLRNWAEHRDLFHWNSWVCASCRICEVCRRAGDPNKLMYCKRCDGAYHCYCQQPPHKNVNHGPYLCSKHTRCHSCGSTVPGSGPSTRWFLGYTCCDACGRLFVKGNYCPVCLKVYRDSETTPMVCCDICERWVHIVCDGISDEKYQQFQTDQNLQYVCAACRGDCYQVKDIDDAVRELWNRRDEADRSLITSLRAAAGLPTEESIFSTVPYSEDESNGPVLHRNAHGRFLKFSVKGLSDKPAKAFKDSGKNITKNLPSTKKSVKKKEWQIKFVSKADGLSQNSEVKHGAMMKSKLNDTAHDNLKSCRADGHESFSSPSTGIAGDAATKFADAKIESTNHICGNEVLGDPSDRVIKIKNKQLSNSHFKECAGKNSSKAETVKGTKLVIHIGGRNRNVTNSPMSESSSCQREQDSSTLHGSECNSRGNAKNSKNGFFQAQVEGASVDEEGTNQDNTNQMNSSKHGDKHKNIIKIGKVSDMHGKSNGNIVQETVLRNSSRSQMFGKKGSEVDSADDESRVRNDEAVPAKHAAKRTVLPNLEYRNKDISHSKAASSVQSELKPLLKLKFKNPYFEQKSSWASQGEEENSVKGHRSKRKRPLVEKISSLGHEGLPKQHPENQLDEAVDVNWILRKLGKDAIGKKVEVQQRSGDSWKRGVVSNLIEGTSSLSVRFDDGRSMTLELGKQLIRFIPQKHKKVKT